MTDIPNSYEEAQKLINDKKKTRKKGFTLFRTILISLLSIAIVFGFWLFYPLSAPDSAISILLPADTAISLEIHNPSALLESINSTKYINKLKKLPIWESLSREYRTAKSRDLSTDTADFITELNKMNEELFGIGNILAVAGGVSYSETYPVYNAVVWLDNLGLLAYKFAELTNKPQIYKGIKYYTAALNSHEKFYVAKVPNVARAVILTTDLKCLTGFNKAIEPKTQTQFSKRDDIIEAILFPAKIPQNNILSRLDSSNDWLNITWSLSEVSLTGRLALPENLLISSKSQKHVKKLDTRTSAPNLSVTLTLPEGKLTEEADSLLYLLSRQSNPALHNLYKNITPGLFKQLKNNLALSITNPSKNDSNFLRTTHLFAEIKQSKTAQAELSHSIESIVKSYRQSNDLGLKILGSQLKQNKTSSELSLSIPFLPGVTAAFSKIANTEFAEIRLTSTPALKPRISDDSSTLFTIDWKYSQNLSQSLRKSIPTAVQNTIVAHINSNHNVFITDILNFLSSSRFFSLSFIKDQDNNFNGIVRLKATQRLLD